MNLKIEAKEKSRMQSRNKRLGEYEIEIMEYEGSCEDRKIHLIIVPEREIKKDGGKEITSYITIELEYHHSVYH